MIPSSRLAATKPRTPLSYGRGLRLPLTIREPQFVAIMRRFWRAAISGFAVCFAGWSCRDDPAVAEQVNPESVELGQEADQVLQAAAQRIVRHGPAEVRGLRSNY
jgi:hypothetical protein